MTQVPARTHVSRPRTGVAAALLASALFAVNGTVSKLVLGAGVSSLRLVEIRSAGAAGCLVVALAAARPASLRVRREDLVFLAVAGVVGIGLVQWLYFVAIRRLDVGIALLLEYLAPVLVALWVRFVGGEQVRSRVWVALALSVVGLAVVAQVWQGLTLDGVGVLAGLGAAISLAIYYLSGEHGLGTRDPLSLAAWTFTAAAVFWAMVQPWWSFPWSILGRVVRLHGPLSGSTAPIWLLVTWVVLLGTVVPYALILVALGRLGPTRTGLIGMAEPVFASIVAWLMLAERLAVAQIVGAAVVLAGIVLAETARDHSTVETAQLPEGVAM